MVECCSNLLKSNTHPYHRVQSIAAHIHLPANRSGFNLSPSCADSHHHQTVQPPLDHESFHLILQRPNLAHKIARLVGGDAARYDGSAHAACTTQGHLGWNVDLPISSQLENSPKHARCGMYTYIWRILVLTQQWQMQQNRKRRCIRSQDHDLADTAIQRLGRFVGALLQLAVVRGLLDEIENFLRQGLVGHRPCCRFGGHYCDDVVFSALIDRRIIIREA